MGYNGIYKQQSGKNEPFVQILTPYISQVFYSSYLGGMS